MFGMILDGECVVVDGLVVGGLLVFVVINSGWLWIVMFVYYLFVDEMGFINV